MTKDPHPTENDRYEAFVNRIHALLSETSQADTKDSVRYPTSHSSLILA